MKNKHKHDTEANWHSLTGFRTLAHKMNILGFRQTHKYSFYQKKSQRQSCIIPMLTCSQYLGLLQASGCQSPAREVSMVKYTVQSWRACTHSARWERQRHQSPSRLSLLADAQVSCMFRFWLVPGAALHASHPNVLRDVNTL